MVASAGARVRVEMIDPDLVRKAMARAGGLINQTAVGDLLGYRSKSTTSWRVHGATFPRPVYEGAKERLWLRCEVEQWIAEHPRRRRPA